jgi:hypothetical protein
MSEIWSWPRNVNYETSLTSMKLGRAIAQVVIRQLPTAAARVRALVRSCGICGWQNGTGVSFLRVLQFPLPILVPPATPRSSSITRCWYSRPNSDRPTKRTQSHPTRRNRLNFLCLQLVTEGDSKLSSEFPLRIIFKPIKQNKTAYGIWKCSSRRFIICRIQLFELEFYIP